MRKLTAVLCVVALVMLMAVPAFANPSISDPVEVLSGPEGLEIYAIDEQVAETLNETVASVIEGVNSQESYVTPEDVVKALDGEESEVLKDVEGYSFTTKFQMIQAPEYPATVKFAGTDMNTKIMLVDPADPTHIVILTPNEDGSFTFPFGGAYAMMDPTPV